MVNSALTTEQKFKIKMSDFDAVALGKLHEIAAQ